MNKPFKTSRFFTFEDHESNARGYCRSFEKVFVKAKGSSVWDEEGNRYIDFLSCCGALNYGHNDEHMKAGLIDHISRDGIASGLDLYTDVKRDFIDAFYRLVLAPRNLDYKLQFTGPTGANAVEAALKLARKVTKRTNVITFTNGFHGVTSGALAATGNRYNRMAPSIPLTGVTRLPYDGYMGDGISAADLYVKMLEDPSGGIDPPAAVIFETVQGEGGLNIASAGWCQRIVAAAHRAGALVIVDDIQAGCGRTGTFFSFETLGFTPDIVTLSKSLSGFGLPMSLVLIAPEYDVWSPAEHNGTFRGNSHAFVTARIALEKYWGGSGFEEAIAVKAEIVTNALTETARNLPQARLKGRGLMQGLDVGTRALASAISKRCFDQRLIIETAGPYDEVIKVLCPLTIEVDQLEEGLGIVRNAALELSGELSFA
ncbi:diaminobutyrate--2-oxoglutarate aminotransferase [Fulvimarina pelagi HTCC2506]|uniref:Diaminobutyrate--2-oxoglutarate transaminase n=2 Tax=Fulvimarina pelagi TaxID=217511 RepID=Q0G338_9HYPH|nr:diaminobutyrate--2-oxoglutarate transaminase [Fulvimarina pelagi]EAU41993.1 diaminobutyrate--2-oxoglutarate aminotransferase [Fulvimarina pelagi HTCC2506]BAT30969.1 diaminobutyrate--2-oxoglutarate aminotransferase [Fulvimarina pelagi]